MSKRILVTGAEGFIGTRLVPYLKNEGDTVLASRADLLKYEDLQSEIKLGWDTIIHLAAISDVPTCEAKPELAYSTNLTGTALLLDEIQRNCPTAHLIFTSSAQVYAQAKPDEIEGNLVFDENREIRPQNRYAETKWMAELLIRDAVARNGLRATVLRLFNHSHKSQSPCAFLPTLYQQISQGKSEQIAVGNLDIYRDIGAIDDLLKAFSTLVRYKKEPLEIFNVCSGHRKHLRTLAVGLAERMGARASFVLDPARVRKNEPRSVCGSHAKLTQATGWAPSCRSEADLLTAFLREG